MASRRALPDPVKNMLGEAVRQARAWDASVSGDSEKKDAVWAEVDALVSSAYRAAAGEDDAVVRREAPDDGELARFPQTDLGNGERLVARFRDRLMYVPAIGWHFWDGRRWAHEGADEKVARAAHETARAIQNEAAALRGSSHDIVVRKKRDGSAELLSDRLAAWGRSSEAVTKLTAMVKIAAAYLSVEADELDSDPYRITVLNGTIVVEGNDDDRDPIRLKPHDPGDLITKLAPVTYDPAASCPRYDRFLQEVQPSAKMRRFLHAWFGYSLTGDTEEQKLCFLYGKGKNGKSTLVDTIASVAGDYGEMVPIETFLDQGRGRNAGGATPDLALLPGVRFLRTSEPEKGAKLAEALIKLVTGGEPIQARHLNRDYFKFRPSFKLTMSGNYRPSISGADEGIWRRVVLVPWQVTVAKPELHLLATLRTEASGILNRLLDGLRDYLETGLPLPEEIVEATQNYREDSDPLGRFLATCVVVEQGSRVQSSVMHRTFNAWAKASGANEWSPKGLASALKERGYRSKQSNCMFWMDCRLVRTEVDFIDPAPPDGGDDDDR